VKGGPPQGTGGKSLTTEREGPRVKASAVNEVKIEFNPEDHGKVCAKKKGYLREIREILREDDFCGTGEEGGKKE